jgi:hypothetical protein
MVAFLLVAMKLKYQIITVFPIFRSNPFWVVGMPVPLAICCFITENPNNLFHENENPHIWFIGLLIVVFLPGRKVKEKKPHQI